VDVEPNHTTARKAWPSLNHSILSDSSLLLDFDAFVQVLFKLLRLLIPFALIIQGSVIFDIYFCPSAGSM
jgi:hypothetical protein